MNSAPRQQLDVFVFGSNSFGELGLGDATKKTTITGPVLNPKLPASDVGVVHLAVGGVHAAAITYDNQILTWGVNDDGALGRDTKEDKVLTEINGQESDSEDSDSDEEVNLNMKEATPIAVGSKYFPKGTTFCQLVATDTATFALTTSGVVYGWGRFKVCEFKNAVPLEANELALRIAASISDSRRRSWARGFNKDRS